MKARDLWVLGFILLIIAVAAWLYFGNAPPGETLSPDTNGTGTTTPASISDGTITFIYNDGEWGLAVRPDQILDRSVIPPCSEDFAYCFYYVGDSYEGTNFESAGLRIEERTDLSTEPACLATLPRGYSNMTATTASSTSYSTAKFAPLGDAATGHFSSGALYRLSYGNDCYEFETRIGQSQFANYPEGTIREFTDADKRVLEARVERLLQDMTLPGGERPFAAL